MSALTEDFWVCAGCRSLNNARAGQCYNCRTPRDLAEVDPATIEASAHRQVRPLDLPAFRPSRGVAALASVLLLAIAGIEVVDTVVSTSLMLQILNGVDAAPEQLRYVGTLGILAVGIAALALIGWSLWLSRAVTAMPALGLGYPPTSGAMAFVENFLPIINLFRVPPIVRDVVERVQPAARRSGLLVFTAWIALLVGFTVPRIVILLAGEAARSDPTALRAEFVISVAGAIMVIMGSIVLVALIWWVEDRITASRADQIADAHAAQAAWQSPIAAPALDAVERRSAFAAMGGATATEAVTMAPSAEGHPAEVRPSMAQTQPVSAPTLDPLVEPHVDGGPIAAIDTTAPADETANAAAVAMPGVAASLDTATARAAHEPAMRDEVGDAQPARIEEPVTESALIEEPRTESSPIEQPEVEAPPEPAPASAAPSNEPVGLEDTVAASTSASPLASEESAPTLTIRVASRGMMLAEMDGESEPVILDDLTEYAEALAKVGGSASIIVPDGDGMGDLIARRAQRILEDADVVVTIR